MFHPLRPREWRVDQHAHDSAAPPLASGNFLRITFVLPFAGTAGGTRVVATYAHHLQQRGHQVVVVSTPRPDPGMRKKVRSFLRGNGWPKSLGASHFDQFHVDHRIIDRFRPVTDTDVPDADVIIATWWETAEWVAKLSPAKGIKAYFIQHDETQLVDPSREERVIATWRLAMNRITIAQWLVDLAHARCPGEPMDLIPNAVDLEQFTAPQRTRQSTPTVGLMYSQAPFKGCDISLRAVELARQSIPRLKLIAFGTQSPNGAMPLPHDTHFTREPSQELIPRLYSSCDAWLFGSRSEGFGLPLLEAMACRTPLIATPAGAAPELLQPGGGILINPNDPRMMADAILRICHMSDTTWRVMSDIARRTAEQHTWSDATTTMEAALQRMTRSGNVPKAPMHPIRKAG
jgi:glycosyltransferase involved in cell wall biosynthesis